MAIIFVSAVGILSAQERQLEGVYGIDHAKKIVVATGQIPEGIYGVE